MTEATIWAIKAQKCESIIRFIQHLFGIEKVVHHHTGESFERWELGLDYLQLLVTSPEQKLPILMFFSKQNATGKSTFSALLKKLLTTDFANCEISDLQGYATKEIVSKKLLVLDELPRLRGRDFSRLFLLHASEQMTVNEKHKPIETVNVNMNFHLQTNHFSNVEFMKTKNHTWIIQTYPPAFQITNLMEVMTKELPAFVSFLYNRELVTKRESRTHFHKSLIQYNH